MSSALQIWRLASEMKVRNYYRLKEGCGLRGWLFNPYSLVRDDWYAPVDLSAEEFNVLVRCDGETIFGDNEPENVRTILERYESEGIIKACGNLHPVSDAQRYRFYPCWRFDAIGTNASLITSGLLDSIP